MYSATVWLHRLNVGVGITKERRYSQAVHALPKCSSWDRRNIKEFDTNLASKMYDSSEDMRKRYVKSFMCVKIFLLALWTELKTLFLLRWRLVIEGASESELIACFARNRRTAAQLSSDMIAWLWKWDFLLVPPDWGVGGWLCLDKRIYWLFCWTIASSDFRSVRGDLSNVKIVCGESPIYTKGSWWIRNFYVLRHFFPIINEHLSPGILTGSLFSSIFVSSDLTSSS